jgi:nitroimidazol reductase NimA-like FMN-containing flavoprotein (pyridoxamine 5'-phosphate oxidase superfamily)
MGLQLTDAEREELLTTAHTATITTLRRDGWPVSLPLWFLWSDGQFYIGTPPGSAKIKRIRHDDRCCVLVEKGKAWVDLVAVEFPARAVALEAGPESEKIAKLLDEKYADFQPPWDRVPEIVLRTYAERTYLRLEPAGPVLSWANSKIRLKSD